MGFNLYEYINDMKKEIKEVFLKDINFDNKIGEKVVNNLKEPLDSFFNEEYRSDILDFAMGINNAYIHLSEVDLDPKFISSKEEVDSAIQDFTVNVNMAIKMFKNSMLSKFAKVIGSKPNLINNDLSFIEFKFNNMKKVSNDKKEVTNENEITCLKKIFEVVYALACMLEDKEKKMREVKKNCSYYEIATPKYNKCMEYYFRLLNERDYDKFSALYEEFCQSIQVSGKGPR